MSSFGERETAPKTEGRGKVLGSHRENGFHFHSSFHTTPSQSSLRSHIVGAFPPPHLSYGAPQQGEKQDTRVGLGVSSKGGLGCDGEIRSTAVRRGEGAGARTSVLAGVRLRAQCRWSAPWKPPRPLCCRPGSRASWSRLCPQLTGWLGRRCHLRQNSKMSPSQ